MEADRDAIEKVKPVSRFAHAYQTVRVVLSWTRDFVYERVRGVARDWHLSFGLEGAASSQSLLEQQGEMYRARARCFQRISFLLLIATILLIVNGIRIFVRGDTEDNIFAENEVNLRLKIEETKQAIDAILGESARTEQSVNTYERAKVLATVLARAKSGVIACRNRPNPTLIKSTLDVVRAGEAIASHSLIEDRPPVVEIMISNVVIGDSNSFPAESLQIIRDAARNSSIDFGVLRGELGQLSGAMSTLLGSGYNEMQEGTLIEQALLDFNSIVDGLEQLNGLDSVLVDVSASTDIAKQRFQELSGSRTTQLSARQDLEREKEELERELTEVRQQREKILFMAWIPGLTLRVGAVVLLLFLTQILLATYRYTLAISAFYLARSDAIQLVRSTSNQDSEPHLADLVMLFGILTPTSYQVDSVTDPAQQVTRLAEAWIGKVNRRD